MLIWSLCPVARDTVGSGRQRVRVCFLKLQAAHSSETPVNIYQITRLLLVSSLSSPHSAVPLFRTIRQIKRYSLSHWNLVNAKYTASHSRGQSSSQSPPWKPLHLSHDRGISNGPSVAILQALFTTQKQVSHTDTRWHGCSTSATEADVVLQKSPIGGMKSSARPCDYCLFGESSRGSGRYALYRVTREREREERRGGGWPTFLK